MDWSVQLRRSGRSFVLAVNGRFVEVEVLGRREVRTEWGSVSTEAQDAMAKARAESS